MTQENELACQEVVELVTAYLEDALAADLRLRFEEHVAECPGCTTYIEQMRLTIRLLRDIPQESPLPTPPQELLQVFRVWKQG